MPDKAPLDDDRLSHGLCPACAEHFHRQWSGLDLAGYLEGLETPVVVVDEDGRIMAANQAMSEMLGRPPQECRGLLGGEVFECAHARLPEGCGRTVHCAACTLRRAVTETARSGKPLDNVVAYVERSDGRTELTLSTERIPQGVRVTVSR